MKDIIKAVLLAMSVSIWYGCGLNDVYSDLTPMLSEGNKWISESRLPTYPRTEYTIIQEVKGDTMIDGTMYKKVYCTIEGYDGDLSSMHPECECYREAGGKIFFYHKNKGEQLLYDFTIKQDDTTVECEAYHRSAIVKTVYWKCMQDGVNRKHIQLNNSDVWVEGLGSLKSGLLPYSGPGVYGSPYNLLQFISQGKVVYSL